MPLLFSGCTQLWQGLATPKLLDQLTLSSQIRKCKATGAGEQSCSVSEPCASDKATTC